MALQEEFERQGNWLFRHRSFLPLLTLPLIVLAFQNFDFPYGSHILDTAWEGICLAVSLLGLVVRVYTVGHTPRRTSGRNSRKGQVAETLNTTGIYSLVRHPLYLGNFLLALGPCMFLRAWWLVLVFVLAFWVYYERIMYAEEAFLRKKFGDDYASWADHTNAFFPSLRNWRPNALPFSWRKVLKREHQTLFLIVTAFTAMELVGDVIVYRKLEIDPIWAVLFGLSLSFFLVVRFLRKRTNLLRTTH